MSNLASVQTIIGILPIEGADKIELAQILGWQCVVEKGKYKPGDKVIYTQIDTLLPYRDEYAFLKKDDRSFKEYGVEYGEKIQQGIKYYRLKTSRFLGNLSQGLVLPLSITGLFDTVEIGTDVSDMLGFVKYEKPAPVMLHGAKGNYPSYIYKTDEERLQNVPRAPEHFHGKEVYETLKLDGTSATYYYLLGSETFGVCSRRLAVKEDGDNLYALMARRYFIKEHLAAYCHKTGKSIALQGEIAGPGIQGNKLKLPAQQFFMFTVQEIDEQGCPKYLGLEHLAELARLSLTGDHAATPLQTVPMLGSYTFDKDVHTLGYYLEKAAKLGFNGVNCIEGIVIRTTEEHIPPRGLSRCSFKVINNEYKD